MLSRGQRGPPHSMAAGFQARLFHKDQPPCANVYQTLTDIIQLTSHWLKPGVGLSLVSRREGTGKHGCLGGPILCVALSCPRPLIHLDLPSSQGSEASRPFSSNPYLLKPTHWHPIWGPVLLAPCSVKGKRWLCLRGLWVRIFTQCEWLELTGAPSLLPTAGQGHSFRGRLLRVEGG